MMHRTREVGPRQVAAKPANKVAPRSWSNLRRHQLRRSRWSERRGQGECGLAKHGPDTEPGKRVTGAKPHYGEWQGHLAVTHPRWEPYSGKPHLLDFLAPPLAPD
jgi:hypothetical protein